MKIAFRISKMTSGGTERVFLSVADGLSKLYPVEIHFVLDALGKGETESVVLAKGYQLIGLNCQRTLQTLIPLKKYLEKEQPDILISAYPDTNCAAILSKMLAKSQCKIIVSEHAPLRQHWQNFSLIRKMLLNAYVRIGYRFADQILAVSKGLMSELISFGLPTKKVSFIYNPVRFKASNDADQQSSNQTRTIIAVGRITYQKDFLTLLKAFHHIHETTHARLVFVGGIFDALEMNRLEDFVNNNNLSKKVEFVGFTENVQHYYKNADVFALSSAWEGFGNVLVEALAFGLPIVSTNCNYGPNEILNEGEFGKLVPVGDWQAMAKALQDTLNHLDAIDAPTLKRRALAFTEENIAKQYWQLIQKTLTT